MAEDQQQLVEGAPVVCIHAFNEPASFHIQSIYIQLSCVTPRRNRLN